MEAGSVNSYSLIQPSPHRLPLQERLLHRRNSGENMDRFRPNTSAMDFDYAHCMATTGRTSKENLAAARSPAKEAYVKMLAEALNMNRTRILAFKNKPPTPTESISHELLADQPPKSSILRRCIPQTSERTLDAPDLIDDYYLNLLDWGSGNVLSISLGTTVYLWETLPTDPPPNLSRLTMISVQSQV